MFGKKKPPTPEKDEQEVEIIDQKIYIDLSEPIKRF